MGCLCYFQTQQLFSNCMKVNKRTEKGLEIKKESSDDGDCSCEMLDTSLSGVGESDCSCSECLQANLEAFNELKQAEEEKQQQEQANLHRGGSTRTASNKQTRGVSRNTVAENRSTAKIGGFKSAQKMRETRPKTSVQRQQISHQQVDLNGEDYFPKFSRECVNDYIKITQYRARQYLKQRQNLQRSEQQERAELKSLIKENLQVLKFTAKNLVVEQARQKESEGHGYKWNHQPYHCRSKLECRKMRAYSPNFEEKKEEIKLIKERIKKYKEENKDKPYECPDQCPKHHLRTSKKKLIEIEKFIQQKAQAYVQAKRKAKLEKEEKQKVKEAKLRAIDLKCKEKVTKSKKYDPTEERTSFHNSIDHFSTFSELRVNNQDRAQEKKRRQRVKEAMKDGKQLEQAIYQNLEEELIGDHPPIHSKINVESRYVQGEREEEEWCEKIVKDARIRPPKDIKKDDKELKKAKERKKAEEQKQRENQRKSNKHLTARDMKKEEERRKEVQAEIERKKQEIMQHYQKRNSNLAKPDPKNKILREEYEQQIKREPRQASKKPQKQKNNANYDPYRQVYQHQASKDPKQMNIVGDPLLEEYSYQQSHRRAQQLSSSAANKQIFTSSGRQLMQKKVLKV